MLNKDEGFYWWAAPTNDIQGNKLNNFKIRTPENLILSSNYECALVESCLPNNIYNIPENSYFCISRYKLKSKVTLNRGAPHRKNIIYGSDKKAYGLEYAVRVHVNEGFYNGIEHLKNVIQTRVTELIGDSTMQLPDYNHVATVNGLLAPIIEAGGSTSEILLKKTNLNSKRAELANEYYSNAMEGKNKKFPEFFIGKKLTDFSQKFTTYMKEGEGPVVDSVIVPPKPDPSNPLDDALNNLNTLHRFHLVAATGYIGISRDFSPYSHHYISKIVASPAITAFLGFERNGAIDGTLIIPVQGLKADYQFKIHPHDTFFLYLNILENSIVSSVESQLLRIIPVAAMKPDFGSIMWTEYKNLQYQRVNTKHLHYLHFTLFDRLRRPIRFETTASTVYLALHFRPIKHTGMEL